MYLDLIMEVFSFTPFAGNKQSVHIVSFPAAHTLSHHTSFCWAHNLSVGPFKALYNLQNQDLVLTKFVFCNCM